MHAMTQLRIFAENAALDRALSYPRPPLFQLYGIDSPHRGLIDACADIERARKAAKVARDWTIAETSTESR